MAIERKHLYCDESGIDGKPSFYIGGIECTPRRAEILKAAIKNLRDTYLYYHEFKWQSVGNNAKYVTLYKALIDIFLNDKYSGFHLMKINKNEKWKSWTKTEEERFFRCYYYFLLKNMNPYKRYQVFLDDKSISKKYKWKSLYWSITNKFNQKEPEYIYGNKKLINSLIPIDSKKDDLIQLVDVLINAATAKPQSEGKKELAEYLQGKIGNDYHEDWQFDYEKVKKA